MPGRRSTSVRKHEPDSCKDDDCQECKGEELQRQILEMAWCKPAPTAQMKRVGVEILKKTVKR